MRERKYTIMELIQFVLRHRRNKAFKGFTPQQVGWTIERAVNHKALAIATTLDGSIAGVCCCTPDHERKVLHVHEILCTKEGAMVAMVEKYRELFNNYAITARRRGLERIYNTSRLVHLLERA